MFRLHKLGSRVKRSCASSLARRRHNVHMLAPFPARQQQLRLFSATSARAEQIGNKMDIAVGETVHGFTLLEEQHIKDYDCNIMKFEHKASGAVYHHVEREDTDNVFCVAFRTPVEDSNGLPHILEHTTLCGSEKYPVRDPFFLLLRRSLKTFMNAMTANDFTLYPFSTQNQADYKNLLSVYLDSTFFPLLRQQDFSQEGHRLEQTDLEDPDTPLEFKGVVFNEMKGAMSDSGSIFAHKLSEKLFAESTYKNNSGGEPLDILDLEYDDLVEFHARHYHPNNAAFFSYGTFDPRETMQTIEKEVLDRFPMKSPSVHTLMEPRVNKSGQGILEITGPEEPIVTDPNKQSKAALAYLCKPLGQLSEDVSEAEERFALSLTSSLLLNGPTAPMYKSLLADNRGSGYSPCTGYEGENLDGMFSVGLSDVAEKDAEWVVDTVEKTLQEVAENGFDQERIDAASHLVELSLREVKQHFGLGMIYNMVPLWVHGRDIFPNFHVSHLMGKVRAKLQEGPFLQNLIKHHFLENTHKVKVQMVADANYNADIGEQEQQKLKAKTQDLETADITELYQQGLALQAAQEEIVDPDVLPTLTVADIAPLGTYYEIEGATEQAQLKLSRQPSNGVAYFSGVVDTDSLALTPLQRSYLPLFADYVSMVGAGDLTYGELQQELELYSGGVGAGVGLTSSHSEIDTLGDTYLSFSVKALSKNVNRSFELLSSILTTPRFVDAQDRLKVLLGGTKSDLQDSGHVFAALHVKSFLTPQGYKRNELFGLPQVRLINTLKSEDPVEQDAIIEKLAHTLASISTVLAEQPSMFKKVLLTGDDDTLTVLQKNAENHWGLQGEVEPSGEHSLEGFQSYVNSSPKRAFFPLPIQVNHCALAVKTVAPAHPDSAVLMIAAEVLSWGYLHREIREKGGAYGGGCSSGSGVLAFRSYRDPNTLATIETFIKGGEWLADPDNFTDLNVSEAILSVFSGLDSPVGLSARGKGAFINGLTNAEKQEYRTRLLAVTKTDVLRVAEVYMNRAVMSSAPTCVIGAQETMPEKTLLAEQGWELCDL